MSNDADHDNKSQRLSHLEIMTMVANLLQERHPLLDVTHEYVIRQLDTQTLAEYGKTYYDAVMDPQLAKSVKKWEPSIQLSDLEWHWAGFRLLGFDRSNEFAMDKFRECECRDECGRPSITGLVSGHVRSKFSPAEIEAMVVQRDKLNKILKQVGVLV